VALAVLAFSLLTQLSPSGEKVGYDQLKNRIRAGEVEKVTIGATEVRAQLKLGEGRTSVVTTGRGNEEQLEKLLDEHKVAYTYDSGGGLWAAILPWVIVFGGMVLFWGWILRRMKPGAGMMAIGKSKAKLVGEKTGVTFADVAGVEEAV